MCYDCILKKLSTVVDLMLSCTGNVTRKLSSFDVQYLHQIINFFLCVCHDLNIRANVFKTIDLNALHDL